MAKFGFGIVVEKLRLKKKLHIKRIKCIDVSKHSIPVRARLLLEGLGPTFIKFGQILSTRPDLIPKEFITEFEKLQDNAPPLKYSTIENEIKKELGNPIKDIFSFFDKKPLASASIGQVHKAKLKNKKQVIVKVQRPNISKKIESDIEILFDIARLFEKYVPESKMYNPTLIVNEFAKTIRREMDYMHECRNADKIYNNFKNDPSVFIPKTHWKYVTKHVLVMDYVDGVKIKDLIKSKGKKKIKIDIARKGANAYMKQILIHGFFHADPHPANILIVKNKIIGFVDFGIVGFLDYNLKRKLMKIFIALTQKDTEKIVNEFLSIGMISEDTNIPDFRTDLSEVIEQYYSASLEQINIVGMLSEIIDLIRHHKIRIPHNFTLLIKTLLTLESVGRQLDPNFNLFKSTKPLVNKAIEKETKPANILKRMKKQALDVSDLLSVLPRKINILLEKAEQGKMKVQFEHRGLEKIDNRIDRTTDKLTVGIVISALIVGSSIITTTNVPELVEIGKIGFIVAGLLGFILVVVSLKSKEI